MHVIDRPTICLVHDPNLIPLHSNDCIGPLLLSMLCWAASIFFIVCTSTRALMQRFRVSYLLLHLVLGMLPSILLPHSTYNIPRDHNTKNATFTTRSPSLLLTLGMLPLSSTLILHLQPTLVPQHYKLNIHNWISFTSTYNIYLRKRLKQL